MTVDGAVVERRLRPIYEWLDLGHTRKAIQECDKVLKKQPGLHCAIVLRGLALLRSGKHEDAEQSIGQVVTAAPTDDSTLQALTIYFRETHQLEKICMVYEEATKKQSNNEELLSHLFMSYVRVGNYKKQQQIAMALYKLKPKNPYYFWAVISIVMQAREHDVGSSNRLVCLTLAERMVERFYKEGKLEAEAEVLAYLYILELQSKYVEALDVLDTDLSDKITQQPANFLSLRRVGYHLALKHWQQARDMCRELIEQERDNWQHYENYCLCSVYLQAAATADHEEDEGSVLLKAVEHLRCVQRNSEQQCGSKYRAPYLALLQLVWQMKQQGMMHHLQHIDVDVGEELLAYLSRYGSKWCPFSDVRRFFLLLPCHSVAPLLQKLRDLVTLDDDGIPTDVNMLHRHLTWLQVSRCLLKAPEKNTHDHLVTAAQLFHLYESTQHLASQTTATDIRRNDMYLLLCSHSVLHALTLLSNENSGTLKIGSSKDVSPALNSSIDAVTCSNSDTEPDCNGSNTPKYNGDEPAPDCGEQNCVASSKQPHDSARHCKTVSDLLLKLCGVLEAAMASSRANFQLKLLLLQVYNMMGACGGGRNCYESLEVKSVQLDTLGPVLALQALDAAHYSLASSIFSATISFFMAAAKDTCEPMIQAYKFGSLTRIPEFGQFRDRLEHSVLFATVTAEQMILDLTYTVASHSAALSLLEQQSIDPVTDKTDYDSLVDNTDYGVKVSWDYVFSDSNADEDDSDYSSSGSDGIMSSSGSRGPRKPRTAVLHELQLRNATLRLLGAAHNTAAACMQPQSRGEDTAGDVGVDASLQQLSKVTDELEQLQQQEFLVPPIPDCRQLGGARLLHGCDGGGYGRCVALHGKLLLDLHRCYTPQSSGTPRPLYSPNRLDCCRASLAALLQRSAQQLEMLQCTAVTASLSSASALHVLHHTMQTVGTVLILLGFSCTVIRSSRPTGKKNNKKKKKEVPAHHENTCDLSGYLQWLQQKLECHQTALLAKLDTAKRNSRNHATVLYPHIVATFDCPARDDFTVVGKTDGNGEGEVDHNITTEVQKLAELSFDDRPPPNSVDGSTANNSKKSAGKKRSSCKKEAAVASLVKSNDREDSGAAGVLSPFKPDFVKTCLTIDASYQESLANLSNAVASKLKYIASLKL